MDLHVYRNSQDRWHDLRSQARDRGAVLAFNALTLAELVEKLTPDVQMATLGQQLFLIGATTDSGRYAFDAIKEFEAATPVSPGYLRQSSPESVKDSGSQTAAAADAFITVLNSYLGGLKQHGLLDSAQRCWLAASRVNEAADRWLRRFDRIVLHAIYDLSEAEFALVRNLIEIVPDGGAIVLFNTTANIKPTQFAEYTWQRFIKNESLAERTFPEFCRPSSPNTPLLERLFDFNTEREPLESLASLRILQASGRYHEIEAIGSEIRELLSWGESANEVAVVVRHIETYGEMIEDVFTRYQIPHVFETGVPLLRIPFVKYWFALLDLVTGDRSRTALARVMSSAYFDPRLSPGIDVERELAAAGYIDRRHLPASELARRKHSPLTTELHRLEKRLDNLECASDTVLGFLSQLQPSCLQSRDRVAWDSLVEELAPVEKLTGSISFSHFRALAWEIAGLRTIDRLSLQAAAPGAARVRVIHPQSLGKREFRWIFAPGMADGDFPARPVMNPLLPDAVIEELNATIRPRRLLTSRDRNRREPLYLFMILDSVRHCATLTFPASTLEGEPMTPSIFIGEISRHFVSSPVVRVRELSPRETGEYLRRVAAGWRDGSIDDAGAAELLGSSIVRRAGIEKRGVARADSGAGSVDSERVWHPSELNSLAACPFVFLAKHRLNLRPVELPDFEIPPLEIGKLAHEILREFYSTPIPSSEAAARIRIDDIVSRRLAAADINGEGTFSVFDPSLWKIRRAQLVSALHEYTRFAVKDALDGYETLTEYLDSRLPPARLGSILLGGRPDHVGVRRIGRRIEGIRVDDFKYSAVSSATSKLLRHSFQIPVYAWLASRVLNAEDSVQIDGRYLLLRSPSTPVVSHAIDPGVFDDVRDRIEALVAKVRAGRFLPEPADPQDCQTCDYRRLCRFPSS